jgi:hypothetical protein
MWWCFFHITLPERLTVLTGGKPEKSQDGTRLMFALMAHGPSSALFDFCRAAMSARFLQMEAPTLKIIYGSDGKYF